MAPKVAIGKKGRDGRRIRLTIQTGASESRCRTMPMQKEYLREL